MTRIVFLFSLFLLCGTAVFGQRLAGFSEGDKDFLNELTDFVTASKTQSTEELMKLFNEMVRNGQFTAEELNALRDTGNRMLDRRLSAKPYFSTFLEVILVLKNQPDSAERLNSWLQLVNAQLEDEANFKSKAYNDFLVFSQSFFEYRALRYSSSGVNWLVFGGNYQME
ncbi:MAG: hypothetical protein KDC44_24210, partial [Phaeodactylibacter sp.]|nr:hypothetical protein [Phaeodactylibacter sp.]